MTYLRLAISSGVGTWALTLAPVAAISVLDQPMIRARALGSPSTGSYSAYRSSGGVCCCGMGAAQASSANGIWAAAGAAVNGAETPDRESTRLNSSHVSES